MNATASKDDTSRNAAAGAQANAVALLKADHRKVNGLFRQFRSADKAEDKKRLAKEICTELIVHTKLEEEIFYAACREAGVTDSALDEAQVEHDGAKLLIVSLLEHEPESPFYDAQMTVLSEYIKHHVGEEEKPGDGIFAKARAAKLDMNALGQRLQQRKEELMAQAGKDGLENPVPRSLDIDLINRGKQEHSTMARQNERDRDGQGRFTGDDDNGGRGGGRGYYSQSRGRDRDDQGRFTSDEDERGGGRSSRSSRDEDDYEDRSSRGSSGGGRGYYSQSGGSQSGGRERDDQGRFMSDDEERGGEGRYSSRSSRGDDDYDDRSSRGSSGGGRGYYSQSGGSQSGGRGRDDQGRFMGDDDQRGGGRYSSRSSRDDDDYGDRSSRGSSGGSGRGWFGDSEGHSRAAEEGWESREGGSSRSRSSRDDDEDSRSSRGSSGGSSGGNRGGQGQGNRGSQGGQGQGGWFGDSSGHSQAARRGWQNR